MMIKKYIYFYIFLIVGTLPLETYALRRRASKKNKAVTTQPTIEKKEVSVISLQDLDPTTQKINATSQEISRSRSDMDQAQLPREFHNQFNTPHDSFALQKTCPMPIDPDEIDEATIELHFQDADLENLIKQIEQIFETTFITDDIIQPNQSAKTLKGNKISFQTHKPLTKQETWNLFITFLNLAGFTLLPDTIKNHYRIKTIEIAQKSALPQYINVDSASLPDSDQIIRYVYFIKNTTLDTLKPIIEAIKSTSSTIVYLQEHKAFILTDSAYNIKTLMHIIKELDTICMPQAMSVLKLKRADADQVKKLYESLIPKQPSGNKQPLFTPRKQSESEFFPENTKIIAETRTNSLILLGSQDAINKIEEFIIKHIDIELQQPYSPLFVYQVRFADATNIADIMNNVTKFGKNTTAGQVGGVRGADKYMNDMNFIAEKSTNRIIVRGDYEDFLIAKKIMEELDEPQPQVAIEVLILSLSKTNQKELGTQLRSKEPGPNGLFGNNIEFQTSGLFAGQTPSGIVTRNSGPGMERLLGNLLEIVKTAPAGNTIVSLGRDIFGVWGVFQALETVTNLNVVSNPFLMATNKTKASVSLGSTRRVTTSTVANGEGSTITGQGNENAATTITIIPQINSDGMIIIDLTVDINEFTDPTDPTSPNKNIKQISTKTIVSDGEVLALGGLVRNNLSNSASKTPGLGNIPVLGWLFKNKRQVDNEENLLILLSSRIVDPTSHVDVANFTREHILDYRSAISEMNTRCERRDPVHRAYFANQRHDNKLDDFLFNRQNVLVTPDGADSSARNLQNSATSQDTGSEPKTDMDPMPSQVASELLAKSDTMPHEDQTEDLT